MIALAAVLAIAAAAGLLAEPGLWGCAAAVPLNSLPGYPGAYVALWSALPHC
jgi:hypothetical protein